MPDQAEHLRELIHAGAVNCVKPQAAGAAGLPMVVVTGARLGVGATTVAVNIAAALADRGERVLVVDAVDGQSNMAELTGVRTSAGYVLADVTAGHCNLGDAIVGGPAGVKFVTAVGRVSRHDPAFRRDAATRQKQLLTQLQQLRGEFDVLVIDTGAGLSRVAQRLWLRAAMVVVVTTDDDAAVMDAYATIKRHVAGARGTNLENVRMLVNQAENERRAADAERRLSSCGRRFLGCEIAALAALPRHREETPREVQDGIARAGARPRVWEAPDSEFGHAALWLGRVIGDAVLRTEDAGCGEQGARKSIVSAPRIPQPAPLS
jgi:flagellar biosynthesis protein FlhG